MYCVSKMTEFWGSYGESGSSYIRETKGGSFTGLLPGDVALIELDTERGIYMVTGRDGGIIALSTVRYNPKAAELEVRRALFNAATDVAYHYGAKNAFVVQGVDRIPVNEYEVGLLTAEGDER
ncbi:hypothetical protein ACTXHP_01720 [Bacillus stercoris]|uniref:hypothetical protein n=1 Tax=Bacillus stercoris TaxID=2054641 RepID=UPI004045537E